MSRSDLSAASRYEKLASARSPFLARARSCAKLTIPSILPDEGTTGDADLPTPYQGMGARGVNNLASKMIYALMPPNQPFFRLMLDDFAIQQLTGQEGMRTEIEKTFGQIERAVQTEIETTAIRVTAFEGFKHLLVTGNVLLYLMPEGGLKLFRLDRYVVKRDPMGAVSEVIVKEKVNPSDLPPAFVKKVGLRADDTDTEVDIYTWVQRRGAYYEVHQEVKGEKVPGTSGRWPVDRPPFFALRWAKIDGEDYGRGHVEEYIGDLRSLEALTAAIVEGTAMSAKVVFLVNPNGVTQAHVLASAPNGAFKSGVVDDIGVLQVGKYNDYRVALETIARIEQRLAQAFLLTSSIQRDAERVTAEEIRLMAKELEDALGGVYSILAQEFQLPLVRRLLLVMEQQDRLPPLPPHLVRPSIITGMEALGRGHDLNRIILLAQTADQLLGPGSLAQYGDPLKVISRIGTAVSLDTADILKTPEQIQAEQLATQQAALIQQIAPEAIKAAGQAQQQEQPQ